MGPPSDHEAVLNHELKVRNLKSGNINKFNFYLQTFILSSSFKGLWSAKTASG